MEDASSRAPDCVSYTVRLLATAQQDLADIGSYYDQQVPHETERCLDAIDPEYASRL